MISVTQSESRIFWSLSEKRMTQFLVDNKYYRKDEQKGFQPGIAGSLEHGKLTQWILSLGCIKNLIYQQYNPVVYTIINQRSR